MTLPMGTIGGGYERIIISGTLSFALANSSDLELLNLWAFFLTGGFRWLLRTFPAKSFNTESNYFTGTIRLLVRSTSTILQALQIRYNFYSGLLPAALTNFIRLEELEASHILFIGHIDFLFNQSAATGPNQLEYIDLSNNAFSGSIPESLFAVSPFRQLGIVVLYQNCFTGSLPSAICSAGSLTTLILDSVSSAPACYVRFTGLWND
jgi:hypothetical protein